MKDAFCAGYGRKRKLLCDQCLSHVGRAGAAASAMSEKVRTRLEELDDFEEVSSPLLGLSEQSISSPSAEECQTGWLLTARVFLGA